MAYSNQQTIKLYFNGDSEKPVKQKYFDRVYDSVKAVKGCLIWQYPTKAKNPQIMITYARNNNEVVTVARLLYQEANPHVEYTPFVQIVRGCDTPNCVNPACQKIIISDKGV